MPRRRIPLSGLFLVVAIVLPWSGTGAHSDETVVTGDQLGPAVLEIASDSVASPSASPPASPSASAFPSPSPSSANAVVVVADLLYQPARIEVAAGTTVSWINEDPVPHTVTARDGSFNSGVLVTGDTYSQTFDEPGTYDYFCAVHPLQAGSVVVTEPAAAGAYGRAEG